MRECLAALRIVHQEVYCGIPSVSVVDGTYGSTFGSCRSIYRRHSGCYGLQFLASLIVKVHACRQRQIHHKCIVEGSTLGERIRTIASWRVTQDVVQDGRTFGHDILSLTDGEHIEHVAMQRLCLNEGTVTLHGEGHRLQGVLARQ